MIDFTLTEEQSLLQKTARDFAEKEIKPAVQQIEALDGPEFDPVEMLEYLRAHRADYLIDAVDGPWAGRLMAAAPASLHLQATIRGRPGCGMMGVYVLRP